MKSLFYYRTDIKTSDHQRHTALHAAHASFAERLIAADANLNAQDIDECTPLRHALSPNVFRQIDEKLTKVLLLAVADPHILDQGGIIP